MPALKTDPLKTLENHKPDLGAMLSTSKKQPLENPMFNLSCQKCKIKKHRRSIKRLFYRGVNPPDFLEELEWGIFFSTGTSMSSRSKPSAPRQKGHEKRPVT